MISLENFTTLWLLGMKENNNIYAILINSLGSVILLFLFCLKYKVAINMSVFRMWP